MNILLNGANGKMSKAIEDLCTEDEKIILRRDRDTLSENFNSWEKIQIGIDFSTPQGVEEILALAEKYQFPVVIGTTGLAQIHHEKINHLAKNLKILYSNNFSIGINVLYALTELATHLLNKDFQIEIIEKHHHRKKDAPSGTAQELIKIIQNQRKIEKIEFGRFGHYDTRKNNEIGIHSLRCGDNVGEHEIIFAGIGEEIAVTHRAFHRKIFAHGALLAAHWLIESPEKFGLFSMQDVLKSDKF